METFVSACFSFSHELSSRYSVVPFLVLAIGVDDAFIILHAWHKSFPSLPVPLRTAAALNDAGPSITMTTLTNVASFFVGATSLTPAIRGFCIFTAVALAINYIYQVRVPITTAFFRSP